MVVPPPKDPSRLEMLYDSVVDLCENPSIFVFFFDNQCYPEYLITFQWSHSPTLRTELARPGDRLHGTHAVLQGSGGNHESREKYTSEIKIFWLEWISYIYSSLRPALDYHFYLFVD